MPCRSGAPAGFTTTPSRAKRDAGGTPPGDLSMQIYVETGNNDQRSAIKTELGMLAEAATRVPLIFPVDQIIVPQDFDAKVNELENSDDFRSTPGLEPVARTVHTRAGYVLLFHPNLYTGWYDEQVRFCIYWHEFTKLVNRGRFPLLVRRGRPDSFANYFMNLYALYGEYEASRRSFEFRDALVQQVYKAPLSAKARQDLENSLDGNIRLLNNRGEYYDWIRFQISEYRKHNNTSIFLQNVRQKVTQLSFSLIYAYATMDHYPEYRVKEEALKEAPMLNEKTRDFLEYFRFVYNRGSADLVDGIGLMEGLWANFGFRFTDTERGGMRCEVLDI
jgi:hypothetical protein